MVDRDALYQRILADRRDDLLRLQYADAVQGDDPEHAELIRVQVRLGELAGRPVTEPEIRDLHERERRLLLGLRKQLRAVTAGLVVQSDIRRGFVEAVTMKAERFLAEADALFSRAPVLDIRFRGARPVAEPLFAHPRLQGLRSLDLAQNDLGDAEVALLAESPHLSELRWLDLSFNGIGRPGLEALAGSKRLPKLAVLVFRDNPAGDPTAQVHDENGMVHQIVVPELANELQARHGQKRWLQPPTTPWPTIEMY